MSDRTTRRFTQILGFAAAAAAAAWVAGDAAAYTVVTRDGHRIEATSKPEIRGLHALMRLQPHGQLATIQEDQIDWQATEAANPAAPQIAIPSSTKMTGAPPAPAGPIEMKLYGKPADKAPAGTAQGAAPGGATPGPGSADQRKVTAQEAVIQLQKEYAQVAAARDAVAAQKRSLEEELAGLEAKETGYASETSAVSQRKRELRDAIDAAGARFSQLESRLATIRVEVVQLGGAID